VSRIGTLSCSGGTWSGPPGPWLIQYGYDGVGRLCRAQRPWPTPSPSETRIRTEHFYYDGVRRIQELS
jgi:hypothetical protein